MPDTQAAPAGRLGAHTAAAGAIALVQAAARPLLGLLRAPRKRTGASLGTSSGRPWLADPSARLQLKVAPLTCAQPFLATDFSSVQA